MESSCTLNLKKGEIKYNSLITTLDFNVNNSLLMGGDEKGRIPFFDVRTEKTVKLIKTDLSSEIK